ncbi:hypothetical protein JK636_09605 [Clostridium sp. YIM B02515]|uniref:Uncharacterized protein n=1 Tax=Clostridium rhizosphaerae TaxID=2803861 RepID=A0ABS1T9J1_9CLOT|nr:hypothetical protein [Clostridium rhizosphaerae]MBL4936016.1 hypothetical protein [Clostridium rhizosphaerae]
MLSKILYIMFLIILLLASVALTKFLMKKFKLNRWIIAGIAPFVLIIPSLLFENMSAAVWNILSIIFAVMCIMFFEITRTKLEKNEIKGIVNYSNTDYKKKK